MPPKTTRSHYAMPAPYHNPNDKCWLNALMVALTVFQPFQKTLASTENVGPVTMVPVIPTAWDPKSVPLSEPVSRTLVFLINSMRVPTAKLGFAGGSETVGGGVRDIVKLSAPLHPSVPLS